ncbi:hypothetical protein GCM10009113_34510 [Marinobacter szutsaonensis]
METTKTNFVRKPLAAAVMCSAIGLSPAVFGATIDSVNDDNLQTVDGKTMVYTDTVGTASFGWIEPANDDGVIGLGIAVYQFLDPQPEDDFVGCIMAQSVEADPCNLGPDSGKRYKLKSTETNGPIDLVFNVSADDVTENSYRVYGKLSNLTDALNAAGGDLNGFRIETGFGIGNEFIASSAGDGLALGAPVGPDGRFPGGLFGGSRAEGLPFFSISTAEFVPDDQLSGEDVMQTSGQTPQPYFDEFEDWMALSEVPQGWFVDHDGNPSNDSILLAYSDPATGEWQTYEKVFNATVLVDDDNDALTPPISASTWDPNSVTFDPTVAANVQPIIATFEDATPAMTLEPSAAGGVDGLYTGGTFNVLIEGEAYTVADFEAWDTTPVTVEHTGDSLTFATWNPDPDPTVDGEEGIYEVANGYIGAQITIGDQTITVPETFTLDEMIAISAPPENTDALLRRVPGYVQGPIEDLANVNTNTAINVSSAASWPTCTGDGVDTSCTFTMRITALNEADVEVPVIPETPVQPEEPTASSDGDGPIFGCTAGKPGSPFDPVLPSMVLAALAGLWARKRRGTA